jgi:hypothetical protein
VLLDPGAPDLGGDGQMCGRFNMSGMCPVCTSGIPPSPPHSDNKHFVFMGLCDGLRSKHDIIKELVTAIR